MKPWTKTDEKLVYDGYRKVWRRTFIMPDNQSADFDIVDTGEAVAVLALTDDEKIVCFRQFRPGPEKILCELPGGGIENGETPEQGAARELKEETGFSADLEYLGWYPSSAYTGVKRHMVVGKNARLDGSQDLDSTEHGKVELLSVEEFKKELLAGNMSDTTLGYAGLHYFGLL